MTSVHKRIVQFFPEENQQDMYESILLQTIRVPKMLMHLTEQLPDSKYDSNENPNSLRLFGAGARQKKRNTTTLDGNKIQKKINQKGGQSSQIQTNDSEYASIKPKLKPNISPKGLDEN